MPEPHWIEFDGRHDRVFGVVAAPEGDVRGAVLVIHENRGVTPHFEQLVGHFADRGYAALCCDLASVGGGSRELGEEGVRDLLHATDRRRLLDDARSALDELERRHPPARLGVVGFCFGGAITWELLAAGETRLAAAVAFYGHAPDPADFSGSRAAVLGIYGGLDEKVNASRPRAQAALTAAGLEHRIITYDDADHAFFNEERPNFSAEAAAQADAEVMGWLAGHLGWARNP